MLSVSERARILKEAAACELPVLTHLSLKLRFVGLHKLVPVMITLKMLFRFLDSCQLLILLLSLLSLSSPFYLALTLISLTSAFHRMTLYVCFLLEVILGSVCVVN